MDILYKPLLALILILGFLFFSTVACNASSNLIVNGDFSLGNQGFTSDYTYVIGNMDNPGTYTIDTNPQSHNIFWPSFGDHTTGTGNMMIINGSTNPNQKTWSETVTVTPNATYQFSMWVASMSPDPARLQLDVNGSPVGSEFVAPSEGAGWTNDVQTWQSGATTSADLSMVNNNTDFNGNDFAIDDISFSTVSVASPPGFPTDLHVVPHNGNADITWTAPVDDGGSPITGYRITAFPIYNNRLPQPPQTLIDSSVDPSVTSTNISNLLEDCHQIYVINVYAINAQGLSRPASSNPFRPSGVVEPGDPPYVVILLDGAGSHQPFFKMNPYSPTLDGNPSYCPESWNSSTGTESEAYFAGAPIGPWSFFHKWNIGEINNDGTQTGNTEAAPRFRFGSQAGVFEHSYMLDAIAAKGSIILPFSYTGFSLGIDSGGMFQFTYPEYDGSQSIPSKGYTIQDDASLLNNLVNKVSNIWPTSKIVVMGHSQGGLIAYEWWLCSKVQGTDYCKNNLNTTTPTNFLTGFALDSPINGLCGKTGINLITGSCLSLFSYPNFKQRIGLDPQMLNTDDQSGDQFRLIGTFGDSPLGGYGDSSKAETLEHQLLFNYSDTLTSDTIASQCTDSPIQSNCPTSFYADHVSECAVDQIQPWETAHFVVKYCTGDINYFNEILSLPY